MNPAIQNSFVKAIIPLSQTELEHLNTAWNYELCYTGFHSIAE